MNKIIWITFIALLSLATSVAFVKVGELDRNSDFDVYYHAGKRAYLNQYLDIYNVERDGSTPFRYAPQTLPFFEKIAALYPESKYSARRVFLILSALSTLVSVFFLHRISGIISSYFSSPVSRAVSRNIFESTSNPTRIPHWVTPLSFLFCIRFYYDSFLIGQITPIMFMFTLIGLYGFLKGKTFAPSCLLALPSLLKIGPALFYIPAAFSAEFKTTLKSKIFKRITTIAAGAFLPLFILSFVLLIQTQSLKSFFALFTGWLSTLRADSSYFDSSHYGNQSLLAFLLRLKIGYLYKPIALFVVLSYFYALYKNNLNFIKAFAFACIIYIWLMPESMKFAYIYLILPIFILIQEKKFFTLSISALTLAFAGYDIIGHQLFFLSQKLSIPFLTTLLIGWSLKNARASQ